MKKNEFNVGDKVNVMYELLTGGYEKRIGTIINIYGSTRMGQQRCRYDVRMETTDEIEKRLYETELEAANE